MIRFTSKREKQLWIGVLVVIIGIFIVIFFGRPFAGMLRERTLLDIGFWIAIYLVLATIIWHGLKRRISRLEIGIWMGLVAIYLLMFLRMASPEERSHLIEYSVLAIFIHEALKERNRQEKSVNRPGLIAFFAASLIGLFDELIQLLIPARVFDPIDIFFNTFASFLAITASSVLSWARRKLSKKKE